MDILVRIISIFGMVISFSGVFYIFNSNRKIKKLQIINDGVSEYIKDESYLVMKNGGDSPCDTKEKFTMPLFSQNANYIIRRKMS